MDENDEGTDLVVQLIKRRKLRRIGKGELPCFVAVGGLDRKHGRGSGSGSWREETELGTRRHRYILPRRPNTPALPSHVRTAQIIPMDLVPDFHVLSSTRYDPRLLTLAWNTAANDGVPSPFLLLRYHLERLNHAAHAHGWIVSLAYQDLLAACEDAVRKALIASSGDAVSLKVLLGRHDICAADTPVS